MQFQIFCFITLSLVTVKSALPCNCHKKVYPSHSDYYENDEYNMPKRYGDAEHNYGHVDHSKNVGYKPINPPKSHEERSDHGDNMMINPYRYESQYHDSLPDYERSTDNGHELTLRPQNHKNREYEYNNDQHNLPYARDISQHYQNDQFNNYDSKQQHHNQKQEYDNDQYDSMTPKLYHTMSLQHDHRPQTYLPTKHYKGDAKHKENVEYKYLLPGILRSFQDPATQNEVALVTISPDKHEEQHLYPKFNQTVEYLYSRETQRKYDRHAKYGDYDPKDNRQPNYYPKKHQ